MQEKNKTAKHLSQKNGSILGIRNQQSRCICTASLPKETPVDCEDTGKDNVGTFSSGEANRSWSQVQDDPDHSAMRSWLQNAGKNI